MIVAQSAPGGGFAQGIDRHRANDQSRDPPDAGPAPISRPPSPDRDHAAFGRYASQLSASGTQGAVGEHIVTTSGLTGR